MPLETTVNFISDLNQLNPTDGDLAQDGDNHLRNIKKALKQSFPNVTGPVTQTQNDLNTRLIPSGVIVMWSGSIANIPAGWRLCDGNNSTPNLIDRFVVGAGGGYGVGTTGGVTGVTLNQIHLPPHTHTYGGTTSDRSAGHSHTGVTGVDGVHVHDTLVGRRSVGGWENNGQFFGSPISWPGAPGVDINSTIGNMVTTNNSAHQHSLTTNGESNGHTHSFSGTTSSVGSGVGFETRPPFYALAYIMKV